MNKHRLELVNFLSHEDIDIMLLSETHLTDRYNFSIPNYIFYGTNHPDGRAHGGTGVLIRRRMRHDVLEGFSEQFLQATSIRVPILHGTITISAIYCPPRFSITSDTFANFFQSLGHSFIAAGDYNAKHTHWGSRLVNPKGKQLYNCIMSRRYRLDYVSPCQPTYWPHDRNKLPDLIDFGIIRGIAKERVSATTSLGLASDHSPVIFSIHGNHETEITKSLTSRYTNWMKYKKYISSHVPLLNKSIENKLDIENQVTSINILMEEAADHATITPVAQEGHATKITNREIEHLVSAKRRARRDWQEHRSPSASCRLALAIKTLRKVLREDDDRQHHKYVGGLTPTISTNYSLWVPVRNTSCPTEGNFPLRNENGDWITTDEEKGNLYADHLSKVFHPNPSTNNFILPDIMCSEQSSVIPLNIKIHEVVKIIRETANPRKAPGYDLISQKMISELPLIAIKFLVNLFNNIIKFSYFPQAWKISLVKMILKPGKDKTLATSYRPISLLPCLSKLFERIFLLKLKSFISSHNVIPDHQFGFREGHSTLQQVNRLTNEIRTAFEKKEYCCAIFLDVAQAFDKVWHDGLIFKIRSYLPANTHCLLESYLKDRFFRVKHGGFVSDLREINAGVPQGSVLGPFLYLLFTADIPTNTGLLTSTFADDTAVLSSHRDPVIAARKLSSHLQTIETWIADWRIKVNESKSKQVTFTLNMGTCPQIKLNDVPIKLCDDTTYLGIHLDRRLTWRKHIEAKKMQIKLKMHQLHWLINAKSKLRLEYKVLIYSTVVKPIWTYGSQLWGNASTSNIEVIQRVQSKILRQITGAPWYIRNENLHRDLKIPVVKDEIQRIKQRHNQKLEQHINSLARHLRITTSSSRLRRGDFPTAQPT